MVQALLDKKGQKGQTGNTGSSGNPFGGGTFTGDVTFNAKLRLPNSSSNPSSPSKGHVYFNTSSNSAYVYNGSDFVNMSPFISMTGGTVNNHTIGGVNYRSHTFTSSGTLTVSGSGGSVDIVVVAGGGGGGAHFAGGGGAGGMIAVSSTLGNWYLQYNNRCWWLWRTDVSKYFCKWL